MYEYRSKTRIYTYYKYIIFIISKAGVKHNNIYIHTYIYTHSLTHAHTRKRTGNKVGVKQEYKYIYFSKAG